MRTALSGSTNAGASASARRELIHDVQSKRRLIAFIAAGVLAAGLWITLSDIAPAQQADVPQQPVPQQPVPQQPDPAQSADTVQPPPVEAADTAAPRPTPRSERTLEYWAGQLSNERFLRRQSAQRHLVAGGRDSVPVLTQMLADGNLETVENVISVLAKIAEDEEPWRTDGAITTLEGIADSSFGTKATLAKSTLKSFAEQRGREARIHLADAGVFVGVDTVALGSRSSPRKIVRIDETWNGNLETLAWLRWLGDVSFVIIHGKAADTKVLEAVIRMPDFATLVLVDCELTVPAIKVLQQRPRIDAMELRYVKLNDTLLAEISKVRLRSSLFLMGTDLAEDRVERLRVDLPGLEITDRRGGFLGVLCRTTLQDTCEVSEVLPKSGASEAGLQAGDTIIRIGDVKITRFDDLQRQINVHKPGDAIAIRYRRDGVVFDTSAELKKLSSR